MTVKLTSKTRLDALLKAYPFLLDFLPSFDSKFDKLRQPLLRKTLGRVASLGQVAAMGDVPLPQLLAAVAAEVKRVTGEALPVEGGGDSEPLAGRDARLEVLKDIIRDLHRGESLDVLKKRFAALVRDVAPGEIADMEERLIAEGLPESEVKRLCDVHVQVFEEALESQPPLAVEAGHPLQTLAAENRELEKLIVAARASLASPAGDPAELTRVLDRLAEVEKHYLKKENQLFPLLEARGISGPSKVMWAIHDDIRRDLKSLRQALASGQTATAAEVGERLLRAMSEMVNKEEKILFPMSLETLDESDWARVKKGEEEVGYAWVKPAAEWRPAASTEGGRAAASKEGKMGVRIPLQTGTLTQEEIDLVLTHLPLDISVVDETDTVVYYSATPDRIFPRSPGVIGRKVQNCHPSKSVDVVNEILQAFKAGTRDVAEFWIETGGRFVQIRYYALRDGQKRYRGCLEVSQDVTDIRRLSGQKRLLDWT